MTKCQRCSNPATLHITEVHSVGSYDELHLCETCAHKYLHDSPQLAKGGKIQAGSEEDESVFPQHECPHCGLKFTDFRNTGRLGCSHDYQIFKEELVPLLENIHGDARHCGKAPRQGSKHKEAENAIVQLRLKLKNAVNDEDYEEAARIRDKIRHMEDA